MNEPHGIPCMLEIFHFLCSLFNVVEHMGMSPRSNTIAFDEDVPLFALTLINSAIELGVPLYFPCNIFEDIANLLSKSAFPVNSPLSSLNILALDGLVAIIQGMAERIGKGSLSSAYSVENLEEYTPFWLEICENFTVTTKNARMNYFTLHKTLPCKSVSSQICSTIHKLI
ncbi:hypothetical protein KIW84_061549 [Lathyrus oleraceus]|uniref:Uncharacterized protein n=1 Tax=Pisum sativum TaxID=3888 RepID=A0A9D4W2U9_PEA|nr:hypothetical protein KIW84_061549 [Pisum sativum]